jgi:SAM-dependent methyltransferase
VTASRYLEAARERLRPYVEAAKAFTGWDFSQVRTRRLPPDLPWDYMTRARELVSSASSVLDIGTGGGERFSEICAGFTLRGVATEAWPPNIPVAAMRLQPMGVNIVRCREEPLPFADASFDAVVNRHSGWSSSEIGRILKPGGVFFTQQVDEANWKELRPFFPRRQFDFGRTFEGRRRRVARGQSKNP